MKTKEKLETISIMAIKYKSAQTDRVTVECDLRETGQRELNKLIKACRPCSRFMPHITHNNKMILESALYLDTNLGVKLYLSLGKFYKVYSNFEVAEILIGDVPVKFNVAKCLSNVLSFLTKEYKKEVKVSSKLNSKIKQLVEDGNSVLEAARQLQASKAN